MVTHTHTPHPLSGARSLPQVAQADLKHLTPLLQPPKNWDYRTVSPHLVPCHVFKQLLTRMQSNLLNNCLCQPPSMVCMGGAQRPHPLGSYHS